VWNYDINGQGLLAAATSPSPSGPFTLETGQINVRGGLAVGDFALFVDDDGMGKRKRGEGRKEKEKREGGAVGMDYQPLPHHLYQRSPSPWKLIT
jgi:hypothetical protein